MHASFLNASANKILAQIATLAGRYVADWQVQMIDSTLISLVGAERIESSS